MSGLQVAKEKALSQPDARHSGFQNKIALDQRIRRITGPGGKELGSYEAEGEFYLLVAEEAGLTGWELNRLLHNFTEHFETAIKEATP